MRKTREYVTVDRLRDAVCIEKVLVKRQGELLKALGVCFDVSTYYNFLLYVQSKLEYYRIRNSSAEKWMNMLYVIIAEDDEYYSGLKRIISECN